MPPPEAASSPRSSLQPGPLISAGRQSAAGDLLHVSMNWLSAFLAEAAVLTLVLGILDRLVVNRSFEVRWVGGAMGISAGLLGASIALDVSARRWLSRI